MFLRPTRIFRSRFHRVAGIVLLLAVVWWAWTVWPPQPELRVVIEPGSEYPSGVVTADGRSLICDTVGPESFHGGIWSPRRIEVFELPAGTHSLTLYGEQGFGVSISPDGSRMATRESSEQWQWRIRALPSGQTIRRLKIKSRDVNWSPDSRHVLFFDDGLSVCRGDNGERVGRFNVSRNVFAFSPNGSGFVALANDRWELIVHSFNPATPDTTIPLPGRPSEQPGPGIDRPADDSVWIYGLATTNDQSAILAVFDRCHLEGNMDRRRYLARWDRATQRWSEADMGLIAQSDFVSPALRLDARERYLGTTDFASQFQSHWVYKNDLGTLGARPSIQYKGRDLWEATSSPPRCLDGDGLPETRLSFDPTGQRAISITGVIYDPETWAALSPQCPMPISTSH